MAAPSATARQDPGGIRIDDGYRTLITFATDPDVQLWEKSIKPPGMDGGEGIDTTTMHNDTYRTKSPRQLKSLTESTFTAGYDPVIYTSLIALINVETTITITFPDGTTLAFYGYLQKAEQSELKEGEFPEVTCTFTPTNQDPTTGDEEAPVLVNVAGT